MEVTWCPPCSGSGLQTETKHCTGGGWQQIPVGPCPLCHGGGEAPVDEVERFWACVRDQRSSVPWGCAA